MNGQTLQKAFVPLPGHATAVYTGSGLDHYHHSDWLRSARFTSSPSRAYISSVAYAPYGETYAQYGTADPSFTGMNPDTVSDDYDFLFREYSIEGRWLSPDPGGLDAVNPSNPQSWNRYAYVLGTPLVFVDPFGLCGQVGETPWGDYNYGYSSCLPNYPGLFNFYPCFGFLGYWHFGCPQRANPPKTSNDDQKKQEEERKKRRAACVQAATQKRRAERWKAANNRAKEFNKRFSRNELRPAFRWVRHWRPRSICIYPGVRGLHNP